MTHNITKFLDELSELEKNATKGPWSIDVCTDDRCHRDLWRAEAPITNTKEESENNARFMYYHREYAPKLIEAVRVLVDALEKLKTGPISIEKEEWEGSGTFIYSTEALAKAEEILK